MVTAADFLLAVWVWHDAGAIHLHICGAHDPQPHPRARPLTMDLAPGELDAFLAWARIDLEQLHVLIVEHHV